MILILGFLFWFFLLGTNNGEKIQLTDKQKLDILSATSNVPVTIIPDSEKQKVLNEVDTTAKPINLSEEEKLQILNKTE